MSDERNGQGWVPYHGESTGQEEQAGRLGRDSQKGRKKTGRVCCPGSQEGISWRRKKSPSSMQPTGQIRAKWPLGLARRRLLLTLFHASLVEWKVQNLSWNRLN